MSLVRNDAAGGAENAGETPSTAARSPSLRKGGESGLSYERAANEVIADACEMVLNNEKMLARLEKDNAKLARSFRDYMRSFLRKIRKAFTGAEATHAEAKAMQGVMRDLAKVWGEGVFGEGETATQANENAAQESGGKLAVKEEEVSDVVRADDGTYIVRIDSARSGLNAIPKSQWGPAIANAIRTQLEGKAIMTEDGDIISFKRRSSREPLYGPNTGNLREQAKSTGDYTKLNDKWLSLEHAASLVATSRYESWSENHDPADTFKKDGMNHRRTFVNIDGKTHEVDIVTGLNLNEKDKHNYGDKFYDIKISEEPTTKTYGAVPSGAASPYKIKYVVGSSDVLSLAQKNRAVNNKSAKYTTGDTAGGEMQEAMRRAGLLSLKDEDAVSDRELLANTLASVAKNPASPTSRKAHDYP